jgi:hypothetical protein
MGGGDNSGDSNTISAITANCSIRTLTLLRALLYPPLVSTGNPGQKGLTAERIYVDQNFSRTFVNYDLAAAD